MTFKDEIINTVEIIVKSYLNKQKLSRDVVSVVTAISDGKYKVNIDGVDYWVKDGIGLGLSVGSQVWVRIPDKIGNAYICARR